MLFVNAQYLKSTFTDIKYNTKGNPNSPLSLTIRLEHQVVDHCLCFPLLCEYITVLERRKVSKFCIRLCIHNF